MFFPGGVLPPAVGRQKTIAMIKDAVREDFVIGVVAQRQAEEEDPGAQGLHSMGAVARIVKLLKMGEDNDSIVPGQGSAGAGTVRGAFRETMLSDDQKAGRSIPRGEARVHPDRSLERTLHLGIQDAAAPLPGIIRFLPPRPLLPGEALAPRLVAPVPAGA